MDRDEVRHEAVNAVQHLVAAPILGIGFLRPSFSCDRYKCAPSNQILGRETAH
jgi:hypothetical protein